MNIFIKETKGQLKPLVFWCLGMFFLVWTGMEKYSGLEQSGDAANAILSQFPASVQRIIGLEGLDLNTAIGFYGVLYIYIALLAAIQAVILGSYIITKDERDKTIDFLASKPVSRNKIVAEKILSAVVVVSILNVTTLLVSLYMVASHNNGNPGYKYAILFMVALYCVQLLFLSFGSFIAALLQNPKKASYVASGTMMLCFVLYIFMGITNSLGFLRPFSPFKYFEASNIIQTSSISPYYVGVSIILVASFTWATFYFYKNKDL